MPIRDEKKESEELVFCEYQKKAIHTKTKVEILENAFASLDFIEAMIQEEMGNENTEKFGNVEDAQAFLKGYLDKNK